MVTGVAGGISCKRANIPGGAQIQQMGTTAIEAWWEVEGDYNEQES